MRRAALSFEHRSYTPSPPPPASPAGECSELCAFSADGYCDDGGAGSFFSDCALGTDCSDCGLRGGSGGAEEEEAEEEAEDPFLGGLWDPEKSEQAAQQLPDLGGLGWGAERSEEAPAARPEPAEDAERLSFAMVLFAGIGALVTLAGSFFGAVWLPGRRTVLL